MAIVVNTIQAQTRWAAPHVGQEGRVAVAPAFADFDTASTVVLVVRVGRSVAATLHVLPSLVLEGAFLAIGLAVGLTDTTAAALRSALGQAGFVDEDTGAAVAEAPVARSIGDTSGSVGVRTVRFPAGRAERHNEEFAEALREHSPLFGEWGRQVNA